MILKNNTVKYFFTFTVFILGLFFSTLSVSAATINFTPESGSYSVGDTLRIKVVINSDNSVNAVSGQISFPQDLLTLTSISKSNSIVSLWAQEPTYSNGAGTASLEGVILNGYSGNGATVATLVFRAKSIGVANLKFSQASILANDGNGTDVLSGKGISTLNIKEGNTQVSKPKEDVTESKTSLEPVKSDTIKIIEINNNTTAFPSKLFIIILIVIFILLLTILILYEIYYIDKLEKSLKAKLVKVEENISRDFSIVDKDMIKEDSLYQKLRNKETLSSDEISSLSMIGQDMKDVEREVKEEVKNLEKEL